MYGIVLDLNIQELRMFSAHTEQEAYAEISQVLQKFGFRNVGKVFVCDTNEMSVMFKAMEALKKVSWFSAAVNKVEVFRTSEWSDLTAFAQA